MADTAAKAEEEARHFLWRMSPTLHGPVEYFTPVGYRSKAGAEIALKRTGKPLAQQTLQELPANYHIVAGTSATVLKKLRDIRDRLNNGHLIYYGQESRMGHEATMRSIDCSPKRYCRR